MRYSLLYILILLLVTSCQNEELTTTVPRDDFSVVPTMPSMVKGRVRVKFEEMATDLNVSLARGREILTGNVALDSVASRIGMVKMKRVFPYAGKFERRTREAGLHLWYDVVFDENVSTDVAMKELSGIPGITKIEAVTVPVINSSSPAGFTYNDPHFGKQWHFYNPGGDGKIAGADIGIVDAWKIEKGKKDVIIAIIDNLVDVHHSELKDNVWINEKEYGGEPGKDDDNNGAIDDWYGYNANDETIYKDLAQHGTHVAGIIAAKNNNGMGVCGIAGGDTEDNGIRFMTSSFGAGDVLRGIKYAADNGAVICTNSWGGEGRWDALQEVIDYFVKNAGVDENGKQVGPMKGGLVIASAGNEGIESESHFPASLNHVIAVANIGPDYKKAMTSNYAKWVDISAPGGGNGWTIYSTMSNNSYGELNGTSQAAPCVAGVAALIVSKYGGKDSGLTPEEVEYRLLKGCVSIDEYNPDYKGKLGAGCINATLALAENFPPDIIIDRPFEGKKTLLYGESFEYTITVNDRKDAAEVTYEVYDESGTVSHVKEGDKIHLSILNKNCTAGVYTIEVRVTDKDGLSSATNIILNLLPENRKEPEVLMTEVNELTILAGISFSGDVVVKLFDVSGDLVLTEKVVISLSKPGKIDLSNISGGVYTVNLTCNNKTITKSIVKL